MSLFPRGTVMHSWVVVCTQTCLSINMGRELNKGLILMPAPVDGNESRSLAEHVKFHKYLQYPPLKDGCGRRKTLPSAMSSCLGLEPCHVVYTQTLEYANPC